MTSSIDEPVATAAQLKALAHPLRMRILRLCLARERTNKELAELLEVAPATTLRHVRELLAAGFLFAGEARTGRRGAWERPYRATGASWHLTVPNADQPQLSKELQVAMLVAHLAELQAAPARAERSQLRGTMRLHPTALQDLVSRIEAVLREYGERDDPDGLPVSFLWSLHGESRADDSDSAATRTSDSERGQ
jgi:DNA-binding transcriptional ArsR family regulator